MVIKKELIEEISKDLALPFSGIDQDWELEMADSNRINEFIRFYKQNDLMPDKKFVVMSLLLASYDDYLNENNVEFDDKWNEIKSFLEADKSLLYDLIEYWSLSGQADVFRITPLVRQISGLGLILDRREGYPYPLYQ